MDAADAKLLAERVAAGEVPPDELARALQVPPVTDLGFATVDNQRGARTGTSEIIYGVGKTKEQIAGIVTSMLEACQRRVLVTRLDGEKAAGVSELYCKDRRDAIIIFCIDRGCSLQKVNEELYRFGERTIC